MKTNGRKTHERGAVSRRGAKRQFFGCVLVSLGLLNSMLTLKAGEGADAFNYILFGSGAILIISGVIARTKKDPPP